MLHANGVGTIGIIVLLTAEAGLLAGPAAPSHVKEIHWTSGPLQTRVEVELTASVDSISGRLTSPDRLYVDLFGARLSSELQNREFRVDDGLLAGIRIGPGDSSTRVVLDLKPGTQGSVQTLAQPPRLVIKLTNSL